MYPSLRSEATVINCPIPIAWGYGTPLYHRPKVLGNTIHRTQIFCPCTPIGGPGVVAAATDLLASRYILRPWDLPMQRDPRPAHNRSGY